MNEGHLVPLPGTRWSIWRDALVRSAGFPADGLDRFAAPRCAEAADAVLDGRAGRETLDAALAAALADSARAAARIAADPLFREAVTWQNPAVVATLDRLADGEMTPGKRRVREATLVRYWQRYCGKNDTVGFFGPVAWARLDPDAEAVRVRCGEGLTRAREVQFEFWALEALVARLAADPVTGPWLPVGVRPHLTVAGDRVLRPGGAPLELTPAQAAVLARCDGRRPGTEIAGEDGAALAELIELDVVWRGVDMPYDPRAEAVLRAALEAIPDRRARERALAAWRRLDAARADVAAAAGDAATLAGALARLDAEFTAVTGRAPQRRSGQSYAGRRVCYEDTVRDLDVTFGGPVLEALAGPLGRVLLPAARWLSAALADAYDTAFRALFDRLAGGASAVPMTAFWDAAQPLLGGADRPADAVAAEFARRWDELFALSETEERRVELRSADLEPDVRRLFAARRPGWAGGRVHSPDVQLCAPSAEAIGRGEFTMVLGEMHAAWPTLDCALFSDRHPDPGRLRAAAAHDIGPQFRPLYPTWWPRYTARIAPNLGVTDHQLAFTAAPGADPARLVPITALTVRDDGGALTAVAADGRRWPLRAVFALLFGWLGTETFKLTGGGGRTPRVTVDRLVISRETWRTTIGATGLAGARGIEAEYLAARRLRRDLELPERVFAKIGTEVKPVYLDLTGPRYVSMFAKMVRGAQLRSGPEVTLTLSELLPGPEDAWLPDARGRRYTSELRVQCVDPERP